jgi:uncharacterized protein YdeI (YjbR/CyaY-like superfamily)
MKPTFFATSAAFRSWLEKHHDTTDELWVGFYKKASDRPSITWPEAVDVALSFGWIDSVRRSIDDISYTNRFTPRRPGSTWSAVNVGRVNELTRMGLMHPAGLKAFDKRKEEKTGIYSYEQRHEARLDSKFERELQANRKAWTFFQNQALWYRQACIVWVMSAKKEETRKRRLASLIDHSSRGRTVPPLTRPTKSG